MAYITQTPSTSRSASERALLAISGWLQRLSERHMQKRIMRETLNDIHGLSGRDLADIGYSRAGLISKAYDTSRQG